MTQTERLPDQLARWHTRGRVRADPVPIMTEVQTKRPHA
jgi:hypothetical protein